MENSLEDWKKVIAYSIKRGTHTQNVQSPQVH